MDVGKMGTIGFSWKIRILGNVLKKNVKQAEAEVVPSSSFVKVKFS